MSGGIFEDITQRLEENGGITDREYRTFVVLALREIWRGVEKINKIESRVEHLEESSLVMLAKKYPKLSIAVLTFFSVLTVSAVFHLGLFEWVFKLLGIPIP